MEVLQEEEALLEVEVVQVEVVEEVLIVLQ